MALISSGWCRFEGAIVSDTKKAYGYSLVSPLQGEKIFYGKPAIQIYNRESTILGVAYKVVKIKDISGYATVQQIDANYSSFMNAFTSLDRTINIGDNENAAQFYYKEFTIEESCIIFYDDSTAGKFRFHSFIFVDKDLAPPVISITAKYVGNPVPVDLPFNTDDLRVYAEYDDGNRDRIVSGYTITPSDRIIKQVGTNTFNIGFRNADGIELMPAPIMIEGVKRLVGIHGTYDGPSIYKGQTVERRYLTVVADYSDGSSGTVNDYGFPDGNISDGSEWITVSYHGQRTKINVPNYTISSSRLSAFYTGPNIEVDPKNPQEFDTTKTKIQIFYKSNDGKHKGWENVPSSKCTFTPTVIEHEGVNNIKVSYNGRGGIVTCNMMVIGIRPEVIMTNLTAEYTGSPVITGKAYSIERVIVKAYYSDKTVVQIKNGFILNKYIVLNEGINTFTCKYTDRPATGNDKTLETTFTVVGIKKDDTTENGITPVTLENKYPEAIITNNRYRGPAEAAKYDTFNRFVYENITELYKIFKNIEGNYNELSKEIDGANNKKMISLNKINHINDSVKDILKGKQYG